jgi:hypothetical protein
MKNPYLKIFTSFFISVFLATNVFLLIPPKPVQAQGLVADLAEACVGGLVKTLLGDEIAGALEDAVDWAKGALGLSVLDNKVPTDDSKTQGQIKLSTIEVCLTAVKEIAIRIARAILKKQLLDQIVDQTIQWIQDGTQPKFVGNFGEFFNDAVDAGIGETIREIGLGEFCDGPVKAKIQINLTKPARFYERASCTLSDVVGNIEAFKENFKNGSWIGIQEAVSPQNNRHGIYLLAMEKMLEETEKEDKAAQAEIVGSGGFNAQKTCVLWVLTDINKRYLADTSGSLIYDYTEKSINDPPPPPANAPAGSTFICDPMGEVVVTPAKTIGDSVSKAVTSDIDYILNAEDLETYASAILDAAINRLTKDAVTGIRNLGTTSQSDHQQNITNASGEYNNAMSGQSLAAGIEAGVRGQITAQANGLSGGLDQASSTLDAIAIANEALIKVLDNSGTPRGLTQCIATNAQFVITPSTFSPNAVLSDALSRKNTWIPQEIQNLAQARQSTAQLISNLGGNSMTVNILSQILQGLQETVTEKNAEYQSILSEITADTGTATTNRDACGGGGN